MGNYWGDTLQDILQKIQISIAIKIRNKKRLVKNASMYNPWNRWVSYIINASEILWKVIPYSKSPGVQDFFVQIHREYLLFLV